MRCSLESWYALETIQYTHEVRNFQRNETSSPSEHMRDPVTTDKAANTLEVVDVLLRLAIEREGFTIFRGSLIGIFRRFPRRHSVTIVI